MEYTNDTFFSNGTNNFITISVILSIFLIITLIEQYILFKKLGEKGWKSLVPVYNGWTYLKLGGMQGWLILLPVANIIGMIVASFNIPKKLNKSSALGILFIFIPNVYYLILILDKSNTKVKKEEESYKDNFSQDINQTELVDNVDNVDNKVVEKIPEFIEAPALNTEETKIPETTKLNNAYINITPEISKVPEEPKYDEDITSAFEIPIPEPNATTHEPNELIDTLTKLKQSDLNVDMDNEPTLELETLEENPVPKIDNDILEETVELPKMVNEEINSGINVTKRCSNCGFENEYSLKNCMMCGESLE